jgi:alkanesulfonate monooxygenase SsuD/methylene tetrahydromethanopterin reductase-like flavin-dependent oxidoreductase (luciferase family)
LDLPEQPPPIAVAAGGKQAAGMAAELGDALFATEPRADLVAAGRCVRKHPPRARPSDQDLGNAQ